MKLLSLEPESSASANSAIPAKKKMVGGDGFEPSKSVTADLQSAPFGHSGTYPRYSLCSKRNFFIIARIEHFCQYKKQEKNAKKGKEKDNAAKPRCLQPYRQSSMREKQLPCICD